MESFITIVRRYQDQPEFTHRLYEGQLEDVIEDVVSGRADIKFSISTARDMRRSR